MPEQERSPEVDAATVIKLTAEAEHFAAQARKEAALAKSAELDLRNKQRSVDLDEAKRGQRRFYDFTGVVNGSSAESCMQTLAQWAYLSSDPITICFHSPGGEVFAGLRLYDYIRTLVAQGIEVTTVTLGYAASMAGILLQAGSRRVVGPQAWVLIHEVQTGALGSASEIEDEAKFARRLNDRLAEILSERSKLTKKAIIQRAKRKDWWLDSHEVIRLGFADAAGYA